MQSRAFLNQTVSGSMWRLSQRGRIIKLIHCKITLQTQVDENLQTGREEWMRVYKYMVCYKVKMLLSCSSLDYWLIIGIPGSVSSSNLLVLLEQYPRELNKGENRSTEALLSITVGWWCTLGTVMGALVKHHSLTVHPALLYESASSFHMHVLSFSCAFSSLYSCKLKSSTALLDLWLRVCKSFSSAYRAQINIVLLGLALTG